MTENLHPPHHDIETLNITFKTLALFYLMCVAEYLCNYSLVFTWFCRAEVSHHWQPVFWLWVLENLLSLLLFPKAIIKKKCKQRKQFVANCRHSINFYSSHITIYYNQIHRSVKMIETLWFVCLFHNVLWSPNTVLTSHSTVWVLVCVCCILKSISYFSFKAFAKPLSRFSLQLSVCKPHLSLIWVFKAPYLWGEVSADGRAEHRIHKKLEGTARPPGPTLIGQVSDGSEHLLKWAVICQCNPHPVRQG